MMSKTKPANFNKRFDIVGCFIEHDGRFLLLHRHSNKASGDTWGLPAGKMDSGENKKQAVLREVAEETGLRLPDNSVDYFDSLYVRDVDFDIEWHMYSIKFNELPTVQTNPHEHSEFKWVSPAEALQMKLIHDLPESIKLFYSTRAEI